MMSTRLSIVVLLFAFAAYPTISRAQDTDPSAKPLKVLLVAGGCCHDYGEQTKLLKEGIEKRLHAVVTVEFNESAKTTTRFKIYESDNWADGYDVILHDECSAAVTEKPYVGRILAAHKKGVPAVNLHCAMHSYRWGDFRQPVELGADNAGWYEMLGVQSTGHGPKHPIDISFSGDNPIVKGLEDWTTINEELYNNVRVYSGTSVLASGDQMQPPNKKQLRQNPAAKPKPAKAVVAWTNEYGPNKTRVFCTTLGHNNETVGDARYLDFITRAILWSTGNLTADGKAKAGLAK